MIEKEIKHIAYRLKQLKDKNNKAIIFVGAGCSISAGIPRASVIADYIKEKHVDNPDVADQINKEGIGYAQLMNCLHPLERRELFAGYVNQANVNVSHIYLAHLMKHGYVDYIVTTNFDNLMLRALALHNIFPPVYDLSNLQDLTTTTLDTQSIIYLHGQHHGMWQLNTEEEMNRVAKGEARTAINIFSKISNGRPWIVIGYSGEDFIFDAIAAQGRFDNSLFWVGYKDDEPSTRVQEKLLRKPNTQSFWIKGYDADSFFLKLAAELKLDQPTIFNKPFSFVAEVLQGIVDIDDTEIYKDVKQRLSRSEQMVEDAIGYYELGAVSKTRMTDAEVELIKLEQKLTDILLKGTYEQVEAFEAEVIAIKDTDLLEQLAGIYNNWGLRLSDAVAEGGGETVISHYKEIFDKYEKSTRIKSDLYLPWYNWGNALGDLARRKEGEEAEALWQQSFEKYAKAVEIKPDDHEPWNNWAIGLADLAQRKDGATAEILWQQSFEKYAKTVEIKPDDHEPWNNWGNALDNLAQRKEGEEAEALWQQSFEKYAKAVEIKSGKYEPWNNWGYALANFAQRKEGRESEALWRLSFEKYAKAVEIQPNDKKVWHNWGIALTTLAAQEDDDKAENLMREAMGKFDQATRLNPEDIDVWNIWGGSLLIYFRDKKLQHSDIGWYKEVFDVIQKGIKHGTSSYNLACLYAISNQPDKAFPLLSQCLDKKEISFSHVAKDKDWDALRDAPEYIALKEKYGG